MTNKFQTISYWPYHHRLAGRKDGIQMFKKMNSTASYSHIIQQNKT